MDSLGPKKCRNKYNKNNHSDDSSSDESSTDSEEDDTSRPGKKKKKRIPTEVPEIISQYANDSPYDFKLATLPEFIRWSERQRLYYEMGIHPNDPNATSYIRKIRKDVTTHAVEVGCRLNVKSLKDYNTDDFYNLVRTLEIKFKQDYEMPEFLTRALIQAILTDNWGNARTKKKIEAERIATEKAEKKRRKIERAKARALAAASQSNGNVNDAPIPRPETPRRRKPKTTSEDQAPARHRTSKPDEVPRRHRSDKHNSDSRKERGRSRSRERRPKHDRQSDNPGSRAPSKHASRREGEAEMNKLVAANTRAIGVSKFPSCVVVFIPMFACC